jgi:hypothetical protein
MAKKIIYPIVYQCFIFILCLAIVSFVPVTKAVAQTPNEEKAELSGTRKQLATIIFSGLAGAILGLSTLSFYGRPQDNLDNIAIGFAVGVIGGAVYTTYQAATRPYDAYDLAEKELEAKKLQGVYLNELDVASYNTLKNTEPQFVPRFQIFNFNF